MTESQGMSGLSLDRPPLQKRLLAWFWDHKRVAAETTLFVSQRLVASFLVWLMVGMALTLPGLLWIAQSNLDAFAGQWQGKAGLTLYMNVGAPDTQISSLAATLAAEDRIQQVTLITPEQALQELRGQTDDSEFLRQALDAIDTNPLPAAFSLVLDDDASYLQLEALSRRLLTEPGVDDVVIQSTWLERLRDLSELARRGGTGLSVILLLAAVLVTFASVRLAIESRLGELRILSLVGATPGQMRRPFLYFGAAYGLGGGMMAIMLIAVFLNSIETPMKSLLLSYQFGIELAGFTGSFLLAVLFLGWLLGILGALLAMSQRLGGLSRES